MAWRANKAGITHKCVRPLNHYFSLIEAYNKIVRKMVELTQFYVYIFGILLNITSDRLIHLN